MIFETRKKIKGTKKVLLVDDDKRVRKTLGGRLREEDFVVLEAGTGKKALNIFFSEKPDIILLDIIMPGMHGTEVLKQIRSDGWGKNIPVLIITNFPDYPELREVVQKQGLELVAKEKYRVDEVVQKVKDKLKI